MKAVIFRGPGKIDCEDISYPELPADGIILKVMACGICGGDLRAFKHGIRVNKEWQILGHEITGVVAEVGENVHDYQVGERLAIAADIHCHKCYYCRRAMYNLCDEWKLLGAHYPGGMTEYMPLPEDILRRGIVHRIPDTLSDLHSALAEPASSVIWANKTMNVEPSEVVVIFGDGPIGALLCQVARLRGAKPILVGITGGRLEMFKNNDLGAWQVLNNDDGNVIEEVKNLTEGRGADVAIAAAPVKAVQAQAVMAVRKGGRVGLFGGLPKHDPISPLDANRIHYDELVVYGNFSYHPSMHQIALDLLDRNLIEADKIITATYPLEQVRDAFEAAMSLKELKVVLTPHGELS